jgi:A/G-specific adenine glycosylase
MAGPDYDERFSRDLLSWFEVHGRHDLPWQCELTPYRVWVSEIMLQQTQVATVVPYYERFMSQFPSVEVLAAASIDDVLHHWSGLGYYARARNLHRAASIVLEQHDGVFPTTLENLIELPGIGRSTAGAVLALSDGQRHPILDGNVKRVLCRYFAVEGWPGNAGVAHRLWGIADSLTPGSHVAEYTQAIMDLGATLCRRTQPACNQCPVASGCSAREAGTQGSYPTARPKRVRPTRQTTMLLVLNGAGQVLLQRRDHDGLWGGLWSLPEVTQAGDTSAWCRERLGCSIVDEMTLPNVSHGFTHFVLEITPHVVHMEPDMSRVMDGDNWLWYNPKSPARVGLAAIVTKLIASLPETADV